MNKKEFSQLLAKNMAVSANQAGKIVDTFFATISEVLITKERLTFVGFGSFKTKVTKSRKIKTPRQDTALVPAKRVVRFSPGKTLRTMVHSKKV